ncbi:hypothetical protein BK654_12285 [Pseudomonas brassicacearum]|uniref:DUF6124 family protein n=1 Tax=Pseudomonas brassicacearum TaxID=930166 RepID=UPI000F461285|nr:DUF6124 family protein [Pseudomonas brassicacearum]ROM77581.1 hypothetical protein BK654_12285 [Pseudomonas brassicacearum]
MHRTPPNLPESPDFDDSRMYDPGRPEPASHVFTIIPDVDTESLLCHACETLASLNVMTADLACELQGPRRNVALAIQQLAVLGELLVNRALDNLAPPHGRSAVLLNSQR